MEAVTNGNYVNAPSGFAKVTVFKSGSEQTEQ